MRRGWVLGPAAGLFAALGAGSVSVLQHTRARQAWRSMRDQLGSPAYRAEASDRLYDEALAAMERVRWSALAIGLAAALLLVGVAAAGQVGLDPGRGPGAVGWRARVAVWIDASVLGAGACALGATEGLLSRPWWEALAMLAAPLIVAVIAAPLAAGASPGQRAAGVATFGAGPIRAVLASLLVPLAAVIALAPVRRSWAEAAHLSIVGCRVHARRRPPVRDG